MDTLGVGALGVVTSGAAVGVFVGVTFDVHAVRISTTIKTSFRMAISIMTR